MLMETKAFNEAGRALLYWGAKMEDMEKHSGDEKLAEKCIALIYEGANGIQALDLVGRKLARNGGRALMTLNQDISAFLAENKDKESLGEFMGGLGDAQKKLTEATMWLMQNGMSDPNNAGAGSVDYMHMMGLATLAYIMLRMLPMLDSHLAKIKTGAEPVMALDAAAF